MYWRRLCNLIFWDKKALYMSIMSTCYNVSYKADLSLLIFSLHDASRAANKVLRSLTMPVFQSISPFRSVSICFVYLGALLSMWHQPGRK